MELHWHGWRLLTECKQHSASDLAACTYAHLPALLPTSSRAPSADSYHRACSASCAPPSQMQMLDHQTSTPAPNSTATSFHCRITSRHTSNVTNASGCTAVSAAGRPTDLSYLDPINHADTPALAVQLGTAELVLRIEEERRRRQAGLKNAPGLPAMRMTGTTPGLCLIRYLGSDAGGNKRACSCCLWC